MVDGPLVRLGDYPRRKVARALQRVRVNKCESEQGRRLDTYEVENLPRRDNIVQMAHKLRNRRIIPPPMDVQYIDIVGAQLTQRVAERDVDRLGAVSDIRRVREGGKSLVALLVVRTELSDSEVNVSKER